MSRKAKASAPPDREAVMTQVRQILAEHFEVGVCVVSWEDQGTTFDMDFKFGNSHAARALADRCRWSGEPNIKAAAIRALLDTLTP